MAERVSLAVTNLDDRLVPAALVDSTETPMTSMPPFKPSYALGSGFGSQSRVQMLDSDLKFRQDFLAFEAGFTGGVRTALADFNGDGVMDIAAAAGPGGGPHVRVYDGATTQDLFSGNPVLAIAPRLHFDEFVFDPKFAGGVTLTTADVTGNARPDLIVGAGASGGPHVKVYDGDTWELAMEFFAFETDFSGGVTVAAGDLSDDGKAEVVVGSGPGRTNGVAVFDLSEAGQISRFSPYGTSTMGLNVAVVEERIVVGPMSGLGNRVLHFDGTALFSGSAETVLGPVTIVAYDPGFTGGVFVASADVDLDGRDDLVVGPGAGGGPHIKAFDIDDGTLLDEFFRPRATAGDAWSRAGVPVGRA